MSLSITTGVTGGQAMAMCCKQIDPNARQAGALQPHCHPSASDNTVFPLLFGGAALLRQEL